MQNYEQLGAFYLGRIVDATTGETKPDYLTVRCPGSDDACCMCRNDRQRKDGIVCFVA